MESGLLDELDRRLAHALQLDGRASFSTIASVLGVSDQPPWLATVEPTCRHW
ncbi:Lrp/AsnC family transcriptional regulator [Amycolatopsis mediterranei S699]|uniref:Lrp/AsnC family transcriptional regulator n=1 Tax=Amycolatopsis mediterranei (strain U-32) TaxID=749927 RepID=A0A0H3DI00_AMYMU|nr:AsnC family protein [Amycolatopsis mediterranei]ADJ50530.1 Lrp/AsnC family transcriptional regulator [Amycolatopsis mediterranei U32]AFO82236.1 Lrp/AsnC family transcriptional regulator [Amycolatopsis mediterranei S699]AGT89365.1 Lrp/AsnC family transcriptional regulator [Amycolatopsis mediterranei RB]KDO09285.1 AsnC family transcriptional regulator [Amycolatopsis mediterranei]KDU87663.1 AsnC family transcriptional regulator [Amycolatopsis mediterranei]